MMRNLLLALALTTAGCSSLEPYAVATVGKNYSWGSREHHWQDQGGVAFAGELGVEVASGRRSRAVCRYIHISQVNVGPPFNDDSESSVDHLGCGVSFR